MEILLSLSSTSYTWSVASAILTALPQRSTCSSHAVESPATQGTHGCGLTRCAPVGKSWAQCEPASSHASYSACLATIYLRSSTTNLETPWALCGLLDSPNRKGRRDSQVAKM